MRCNIVLSLLLLPGTLWTQNIPIGTWRTHFSYRDAHSIAMDASRVYCAGANTLFFYDLEDNSLNRISRIDGLSETALKTIGYHSQREILVIAYASSNLDLLGPSGIINVDAIKQSTMGGSKGINHIEFDQDLAYLSADFGVAVLDLVKAEIREAYTNIGLNGNTLRVNYGSVFQDSLFLATQEGVLSGRLDPSVNLQDFQNWRRFDPSLGIPDNPVSTITSAGDQMWATIDFDGIYRYMTGQWNRLDFELNDPVLYASSGDTCLLLTVPGGLLSVSSDGGVTEVKDPSFSLPQAASVSQNTLWVADSTHGLVTGIAGSTTVLFPAGPFSDSILNLEYLNDQTVALAPAYNRFREPLRNSLGFFIFHEGQWTNYNASGLIQTRSFPPVKDLLDAAYNPYNQRIYFASYGEGLVEWHSDGSAIVLDENSPGSTLTNATPGARGVLITAVAADEQGNIWAANFGSATSVHRYSTASGTWWSFETSFLAGRFPLDLQIGVNGHLWLRLDPQRGGGILVVDPDTGAEKLLTDVAGNGGLPHSTVNHLAIDLEGQVWVATDDGIALYPFPQDILERSSVDATVVLIDGRPLLRDQRATSIAVDGGNRKWVGTDDGLWLFSAQGDQVIHNFTIDNSPLPSNQILDIAADLENGEIFILTSLGMVSFRGSSSRGTRRHEQVRIFPNPVDRDYQGLVGISGLANNAVVKVADVTGKLVREFRAEGGTAVWDIRDYRGNRVHSGVYLVFSSTSDGNETFIGKIAVIN